MSKLLQAFFALALFFATPAFAQDPIHADSATEPETDESGVEFGVHAQLGLLSPTGLAGGYLSLSPVPGWTFMAGGGYAMPDGVSSSWRVGVGVARHFWLAERHALSAELWVAMGPWVGFGDPGQNPGDVNGEWDLMPTSHLHLAYTARLSEHVQLRTFLGLATNFGVDPSNGCTDYCDGPVIAPSTGIALGFVL